MSAGIGNPIQIEVLKHSEHRNTRLFALYLIAGYVNPEDRYGTVYMQPLAEYLKVSRRELRYIIRHLESSCELTVWNRPNDSCVVRVAELEFHRWPDSYQHGELTDRRERRMWTHEDDQLRKEIRRDAQRKAREA